jgi:GNAT superfamily N-acetyltransferase
VVEIRDLNTAEEARQFAVILMSAWRVEYQESPRLVSSDKVEAIDIAPRLLARVQQPNWLALICLAHEDVLGGVMGVVQQADGWSPFEQELLIRDIAVREDSRRKGLGLQLIESLLVRAKSMGIDAAVSEIYDWNSPSKDLHRNLGFRPLVERWYRFS